MKRYLHFTLFALAVLLHVACQDTKTTQAGLPSTTPEKVGLSSERLQRIGPVMQRYVQDNKLAGLLTMIARHGKVVHFETYGMMDREAEKPMQRDAIFRIYSMSKPITSVAVMMLYEEGRFQLDDPVSKYIPEFKDLKVFAGGSSGNMQVVPSERDMTIRHLLTHTSGLTYGLFSNTPVDSLYLKAEVLSNEGTLQDMIDKLSHIPLLYQPGSTWHYSVSIDVLGYLVEVLSDMPFDQFLAQRIFQPLGMKDTGFYVPEDKVHRFAANYGPDENGGITVIDKPTTSEFAKPPRFFSGGGGLVSTAPDYIRFAQMLLNGGELEGTRLLGRKTVEFMMTNHLSEELVVSWFPGAGFGLGFAVITDVVKTGVLGSEGLSSWAGAANTYFWIDPQEELITMVWTQFMPFGYYQLASEFQVLAYQAIVGSMASASE